MHTKQLKRCKIDTGHERKNHLTKKRRGPWAERRCCWTERTFSLLSAMVACVADDEFFETRLLVVSRPALRNDLRVCVEAVLCGYLGVPIAH